MRGFIKRVLVLAIVGLPMAGSLTASDWPSWRGPQQNGVSRATDLISSWSLDGTNLIWKVPFIGRSTPIVFNGMVYVIGRTGEGSTMQRVVAAYSAEDGSSIWEEKSNVTHTTVPFTRVGWSSLTGDPETGNVYMFTVEGLLVCYDGRSGERLWEHSMVEEFNRFSGYGGRTATPVIDEDLVIINGANNSWGDMLIMKHRFFAYDKRSGELIWVSTIPEGNKNTNYSVPVIAVINGMRLLISGVGTGHVYAMKARTGEHVWKFHLSKGAIQSSVVVEGNRVYASHSAENLDNINYGRIVCIDATGRGDVTETHEVWRYDDIDVGYVSPLIHNGRLYVVTDSGNMMALDADTGEEQWTFNIGKVGKGSPVWADGKIFATSVNGGFHIIEPGENKAMSLDRKELPFNDRRHAEIFGSPAVAYNRVYFASEIGLFCLGDKSKEFEVTPTKMVELEGETPADGSEPAHIQIVPAERWIYEDQEITYSVRTFDAMGRRLGEQTADFSLQSLDGMLTGSKFTPTPGKNQAGYVVAKSGDLESKARVQVATRLPMSFDFSQFEAGEHAPLWPGTWKFTVEDLNGNKVLAKPPSKRNLKRHNLYLSPPDMSGYTIQADIKGKKVKRRSPDFGLIANRYYFDFMTKKNLLQIRTWPAELERLVEEVNYEWTPEMWYTMKMRVDIVNGKAQIKGKLWPRDSEEPAEWTITAEDAIGNTHGSPGLYGDSRTTVYFDNVKIVRSE